MTHRVSVRIFEPTDQRLKRHVEHDERSWDYRHMNKEAKPHKITTHWLSKAPVLDQGNIGSCTGNSEAQWLNTEFANSARMHIWGMTDHYLQEKDALQIYSLGTHYDNVPGIYPPTDTGSSGNAVCKAGVKLGFLKRYTWLFSFSSTQATVESTPVMFGTIWTQDMFTPANGLVTVGSLDDTNIAGGHEYLCSGIDFENEVFEFRNSWGEWEGSKPGGYFAIGFSDVARLLEAEGDVTVPII